MASGSDKAPEVFYPVMNDHGDVMALLDATGSNIVARYAYDPWGNVLAATGPATDICPFRWQTKYFDNETGLYYFGYRFFDSLTGRWLTRDPIAENGGVNLYAFYGNDPVNGVDGLGLWWWDAELIEDGLGGLLGFYGLENTRACWQGSGMLSVESAAIYFNELSFGLLDSSGLTFTHEYKTAEHQAARGVGRITRTVEVGLASQGALSTTYASLAVAGGKTALYGTTAVRAGVTALALNSANQNSGSAVDAYAAGHTGDAIGYSILSVLDMYSAANLMWQSRPMVDVPSQKYGPYVDQKVRGASSGSASPVRVEDAKRTIVIGENMKRVGPYANKIGAEIYTGMPNFKVGMEAEGLLDNKVVILQKMKMSYKIIDIGPDFPRRTIEGAPRLNYQMERTITKGYKYYQKAFIRMGKNSLVLPDP